MNRFTFHMLAFAALALVIDQQDRGLCQRHAHLLPDGAALIVPIARLAHG